MKLARRELVVLAAMLGVAGSGSAALRMFRPVGRNAGDTPVTRAIFADQVPIGGNPQGSLQLALFTDYNCSACRSGHGDLMEAVRADGDVRIHYFDWPIFGTDSTEAARVALAADRQQLYLPVHEKLMQGPRATAETAREALIAAGGDPVKLDETLRHDAKEIEARLARNAFHAFSLGLRGTPSALAGETLTEGALSVRDWRRLFRNTRE